MELNPISATYRAQPQQHCNLVEKSLFLISNFRFFNTTVNLNFLLNFFLKRIITTITGLLNSQMLLELRLLG